MIYQIYPRSFADSTGDGVGDLVGIARRLDHVADLGVDGIWISPFFRSPMRDFGYDISDYRAIDASFGTMADFDRLVEKAHKLSLKLIIDQVYSHTSIDHPWFQESRGSRDNPRADWYVWAESREDGSPPNNWQGIFSCPCWTWDTRRKQYYLHNFLASQPDLNLHHPEVREALLGVAKFWLDRGVDGFRLDAINYGMHDLQLRDNPPASGRLRDETRPVYMQIPRFNANHPEMPGFLEALRALTDGYGDVFTVAEIGGPESLETMKSYTRGDRCLNSAYSYDFLNCDSLSGEHFARFVANWREDDWPSWAFSNHDVPRVATRWRNGSGPEARAKLLAMLMFCLRGNVFVYQGEELGLPQADVPFDRLRDPEAIANWPHTLGRDGARTPMVWDNEMRYAGFSANEPWMPIPDSHLALAVSRQREHGDSTLAVFRRLIGMRRSFPALHTGDFTLEHADESRVAFTRAAGDQQIRCRFDLAANTGSVDLLGDQARSLAVLDESGRFNSECFPSGR